MPTHKSEDYKLSAVKYYLNNNVSLEHYPLSPYTQNKSKIYFFLIFVLLYSCILFT